MKKNIKLLYGFSFFDPFMIVIPVWVPYLATQGITMRQFIDAWGSPSVLSALGILFPIAFVFLLLPLVLSPAERLRA